MGSSGGGFGSGSSKPLFTGNLADGSTTYSTVGANVWHDVDDTNAKFTVTVPASGNLIALISALCSVDTTNGFLGLATSQGGTPLSLSQQIVLTTIIGAGHNIRICYLVFLTGLTAGSQTFWLAFKVDAGSSNAMRIIGADPINCCVWSN